MDIIKTLAFARRIAAEIAAGRIEASAVEAMDDAQLAEYDTEIYQALTAAQAANEQLARSDQ